MSDFFHRQQKLHGGGRDDISSAAAAASKPAASSWNRAWLLLFGVVVSTLILFMTVTSSFSASVVAAEHLSVAATISTTAIPKRKSTVDLDRQHRQLVFFRDEHLPSNKRGIALDPDAVPLNDHAHEHDRQQRGGARKLVSHLANRRATRDHEVASSSDETTSSAAPASTITPATSPPSTAPPKPAWTVRNRIHCVDLNPQSANATLDLLLFNEFRVTAFHACAISRAWLVGSQIGYSTEARSGLMVIVPDGPKNKSSSSGFVPYPRTRFQFPITPFNTPFSFIVEEQDVNGPARMEGKLSRFGGASNNNGRIHLAPGATLLVPPAYCCRHVMHFMEPLGALASALDRWLLPSAVHSSSSNSSSRRCPPNETSHCFRSIERVVVYSAAGVIENTFNWHMIRALLFGAIVRANAELPSLTRQLLFERAMAIPIMPTLAKNHQFEKIIVPGSLYGVMPNQKLLQQFHGDIHSYFEEKVIFNKMRETTLAPSTTANWFDSSHSNNNHHHHHGGHSTPNTTTVSPSSSPPPPQQPTKPKPTRKIAYLKRTGQRIIINSDEFVALLQHCALFVGADVAQITAGRMKVDDLYNELRDAEVLIGVHGADLANTLFAKHRVTVSMIEMNPVFFWEPRFALVARTLGLNYLAWNCYAESCAFGGRPLQFKMYIPPDVHYELRDEGMFLQSRNNPNITALWAATGYLGDCTACNRIIHSTGLVHRFFTAYRGSNLIIQHARHKKEIALLLFNAFVHAGWTTDAERGKYIDHVAKGF